MDEGSGFLQEIKTEEESKFLLEIQNDFFIEVLELLENTEHCYLEMEKNPHDKKMLEEIFRCVHSIKGCSASVGFKALSAFSHEIENLLAKLKNGKIEVSSKIVDLLLKCNDRLTKYLKGLNDDRTYSTETSDLVDLINQEIHKEINPPQKLGDILVEENLITEEQFDKALKIQNRKIGEILLDEGVIEKQDLDRVLMKQDVASKSKQKKQEDYVRLPLSKIDNMLDYFGEQVILLSSLDYARADLKNNIELLNKTILQLGKITHDLQQSAISLRMLNLHTLFSKMQRIVRDVSLQMGKKITMQTSGEETELDKNIIEELSSPLTHLVRNCVDHGIETPDIRKGLGKSETGIVKLTGYQKGGFFYLEIMDDGKGLDLEKIRAKGIAGGFIKKDQNVTNEELYNLIFISGFSTKEQISEVSGRGVGMDVVKRSIDALRGSISVFSQLGQGSVFTIKLPLTLAIFNGLIIRLGERSYIVPNSEIRQIIKANPEDVRKINANEKIIRIKDQIINILDTQKLLKITQTKNTSKEQILIVISNKGKDYAIFVDEIISHQKVVLKKLGKELEGLPGVAGGTILGDGRVAVILDVNDLVNLNHHQLRVLA